jgi:transposase
VRSGGTHTGASERRGSREDGPAGCVKTARNYRAGELTAVWVPVAAHEALRDVVRAREAAKKDQLRARHRLSKFLFRYGRRPPMGVKVWTIKYLEWVKREVHFEQLAQEATLLDYLQACSIDPRKRLLERRSSVDLLSSGMVRYVPVLRA